MAALALVGTVLASASMAELPAAPAAGEVAAPLAGDVEQAVLLDESRPLVLRFEISADGRGFRALWREAVERLFVYLDQDGDGSLSGKEVARSNAWRARLRPSEPSKTPANQPATPAKSAEPEKPIARDEWLQALIPSGERAQFVSQAVAATVAGQPLWTRLDRDGDGALAAEELGSAPGTLGPLDIDEDEMVTAEELAPGQPVQYGYAAAAAPGTATVVPLSRDGAAATSLVRDLFRQYDRAGRGGKPGNRRLEPTEMRIDKATFDQADGDHDGGLNRSELIEWLRCPAADLTATVRFGGGPSVITVSAAPAGQPPVANPDARAANASARAANPGTGDSQSVVLHGLQLHLDTMEMWPQGPLDGALEGEFRALDRDGNGELDSGEGRMHPYLKDEFEFLDRDANGKLSLGEALPFFRQQAGLARGRVAITLLDIGRELYSALDADHDGRLSVRELRAAASKLPLWDANGDGRLTKDEVPHQARITVARGGTIDAPAPTGPYVMGPQNVAAGRGGPRWFQRMDRNGDGDLSPGEFLPGPERFRELDVDGDGLIDSREADRLTTNHEKPITRE